MPNTYTLLEAITVGAAGASSVTFNSIPQTGYTDLVIKASPRSTIAEDTFGIRFNSDSGSNYPYRGFVGQGATVSSFNGTNTFIALGRQSESGYTANTFGSNEFYIPNYTSSNQKSVSIDAVNENNATTARAQLAAGLWTSTAAITSIQVLPSAGSFVQHSTFQLYGVSALGVTPTRAPKATGGSIIQTDGTYWYHAFLSSGTFTPATALSCDYLVVAGGGAGGFGNGCGGGGGAGGLRSTVTATGGGGSLESALSLASGTGYTVTIGAGGAAQGQAGSNSVFSTITATGGGLGGSNSDGGNGGSGGGGASAQGSTLNGGSGTANQGYSGGTSPGTLNPYAGGGGGGAGAVGANATSNASAAGNGGVGVLISALATTTGTGASSYYAGGGGGGASTGTIGAAGSGGGGAGGRNGGAGVAGTANTGGGGGGGGWISGTPGAGAAGGSGIVIVRYLA